jgi:hypothetical protein
MLFLLNVRVHCYPQGYEDNRHSSYKAIIGRYGEVAPLVLEEVNCDRKLKKLLRHTPVAQMTFGQNGD